MKRTEVDLRALTEACLRDPEGAAELARVLAPFVFGVAAGAIASAPERYSTRREGPHPPEFAGRFRAWRELAPSIPGAARLGRWWSIPRPAYDAWIASKGAAAPRKTVSAPEGREWSPADVARDLGFRLVAGKGAR